MKKLLSPIMLLCIINYSYSQESYKKEYKIHTVAFYNLENLFDTIDDISTKDEYCPILQVKSNKSKAYWNKIDNMARVISLIGKEKAGQCPTIIGLCEIENDSVIEDLIKSKFLKNKGYSYINVPSPDWRGIDVAMLYKEKYFSVSDFKNFTLRAYNKDGYRVKTRDQLLVSGYLEEELIHFIINHWPSQRGGQEKSEYLRLKSAELTLKIIEEIKEEENNPKIIVMGDFNDDPTAKSFKKILKTKHNKSKLLIGDLYNPYEMLLKKGFGTLGFRDNINLFDQIILTSNFISENKTYKSLKLYKSNVYNPNFLITNNGRYKGYPFRSWSNQKFTGGFSDHFPVYVYLIKEK